MRRGITFVTIAGLLLGLFTPAHARVRKRRLAKGVVLKKIERKGPHQRIRVVSISPEVRHRIRTVLANGQLPGLERTSSMARRKRALVAINGDYARRSGRPVMTFAQMGRLVQTPLVWGRNFALTRDAERAFIGHPKVQVELATPNGKTRIARVNNGGPGRHTIALHSKDGGTLERPPKRGCSARLLPKGFPKRSASGGLQIHYEVDRVRCGTGRLFPLSGVTVSARGDGSRRKAITALQGAGPVALDWSLGWEGAYQTVGGNPTLVEGGRIVVGRSKGDPFFRRHPRTGIGITRGGKIVLATVDGRQRRSKGMTLRGFARFFRHNLGARWALNLDGGGSTTMVVGGRVINRPSDRSERPVSSAIVLLRAGYKKARPVGRGSPVRVAGPKVWREVVTDPASTGGLSASLKAADGPLDKPLKAAARTFARSAR